MAVGFRIRLLMSRLSLMAVVMMAYYAITTDSTLSMK